LEEGEWRYAFENVDSQNSHIRTVVPVALRNLPRSIFGVRVSLVVLVVAAIVFLWCYPRMAHLDSP